MTEDSGARVGNSGAPAPEPRTGRNHAAALRFGEPAHRPRSRARSTETGGWQALWRIDGQTIRVIALSRISDASRFVPFAFDHAPDLVEMRERCPELSPLWDAIRREYWRRCLPF